MVGIVLLGDTKKTYDTPVPSNAIPVESVVAVGILYVENLPCGRHVARHALVHRESETKKHSVTG